ncbi:MULTISPECIES: AAA family ATPase [unclassified Coleofasciculus]|uniref:AAA family ATPase n=1 Tax=unclassified Coleofasciculus TaxID=2692782 RepID=UPI00187F43B9|nr:MULTISPECIES: AAA family ATPase [unclassified Coleofasciculus]MBE9127629.1 AAA family ATPase [Coleofasciculus sp. LEGE 07081]MBE9150986.1 AAA family ATPase [Coleofasciculus sp. LEGE 07092]
MTTPDPVSVITSIARAVAPTAIKQAQRNELVVKILKELKLDPVQPPKDVDGVYVYALVEYGVGNPEPVRKLLGEREIKNAFWSAYTSRNPLFFLAKSEDLLNDNNNLKSEIETSGIELRTELEEFGNVFINVAKRTNSEEFKPYPDWNLDEYPKEFKPLIKEKTRTFCGRNFVFKAFLEFLNKKPKGYFTIVGDAGMGKSAIAAKYVATKQCPCYFNVRAEGNNKPEQFLESIRQQLIKRYQLQNAEKDNLLTLLQKVSEKLPAEESLVIIIDALDEVEQEAGEPNLLNLPKELPDGVYFLLTRRPFTRETKRLTVSPDVPVQELDLRDSEYVNLNREDVEKYIRLFLNNDFEHKESLRKWIQERNLTDEAFVEQVADKSENNFMYLRYVLPEIAKGLYNDLNLKQLPDGLQDYYQVHWVRMGMETKPQEAKVIVLFILVEIGTPIPGEMIAEITEQDEYEVQEVLEEWVEYLREQEIEGDTCYSFYHASFLDFLKGKKELKSTRKLFKEVNQRIVDFWKREMDADEAEG